MHKPIFVLSVLSIALVSCQTKTQTGALTGAALGAGTGALIGGGQGALIGGAVGAIGGGLIGAALDDTDRKALQQQSPKTLSKVDRGQQLSVYDIKEMSRANIQDDVIISQIKATNSEFHLSTADIIDLKNSGVSQRVIDAMIRSGQS